MSFTTTALAALTLTILALGAPSTKMAYAFGGPKDATAGLGIHRETIAPSKKTVIADKPAKWKLSASVFDAEGKTRVLVLYTNAGPWDSKDECVAFAKGDDAALDASLAALLDASVEVIGPEIKGVGTSCVATQE